MTGNEFSAGMRRLGLSNARMAEMVGCESETIAAMCQAEIVDPVYADDLMGLLIESGLESPGASDETGYLMRSPENARRIDAALERLRRR